MESLDAWVHQQHFEKWSDKYFKTQGQFSIFSRFLQLFVPENRMNNALVTQLITTTLRQQQQARTTTAVNNLLQNARRAQNNLPDIFTARVTIPAVFRRILAELIGKSFFYSCIYFIYRFYKSFVNIISNLLS